MISAAFLLIISFFLFKICIACCPKNPQKLFMQSLHLYGSGLFSVLLNQDIVDIEKPDGIGLLTFVVDEF